MRVSGSGPRVFSLAVMWMSGCALGFGWTPAQAQEAHDIYQAEIVEMDGQLQLRAVENLTSRDGYDNQPAFSADGETLYYTSQRGDGDSTQTDIWAISGQGDERRAEALWTTPESEYSPTPVPGRKALSVIRVEEDGKQKLWALPLDDAAPKRILEKIEPVGYHAWVDRELVLFVLGEPHELQRVSADEPNAAGRVMAKDIGRALKKIPGKDSFSFVHKTKDGWWIKSLSVDGDKMKSLTRTLGEREDFDWSPDGALWMSDGEVFHRFRPGKDEDWQPVAWDKGTKPPKKITRLTVSPDGRRLAFVAEHRAD